MSNKKKDYIHFKCNDCSEIFTLEKKEIEKKERKKEEILCTQCKKENIELYIVKPETIKLLEKEIASQSFETDEALKKHFKSIEENSSGKVLKDPNLFEIINKEFDKKIEGEVAARKAIFITLNMRNVRNLNKATDNLMVNDTGGTGKDHVTSAVYAILPDKEKQKRERISPKVLGYLNDTKKNPEGWVKKCLYLEDIPNQVLNDDCFKVMSSANPDGLTQTSLVANNALKNITIRGKPSIVITIAASNPKQELLRRYPIVNLTSSVDQTKAILKKQAKFAEIGTTPEYDVKIKKALGFLGRIKVKIPFASKITSAFPTGNVIIRTHFPRFLDYIKSSCSLHQFQREKDENGDYIATEQDYEIAREVLAATTSNALMIPLTKNQKLILEKFKELGTETQHTFQELQNLLQHIPLQNRWLRVQVEKLVEYGFIKRSSETRENSFKPVFVYSYVGVEKLELPSFKKLGIENTTYTTTNTTTTNTANTTNRGVNAVNVVNAYELNVATSENLPENPEIKEEIIE